MDSVFDYDGPAALEFRVRHYEAQLKAQAARIIELEAKVAYLEKCLIEASAKATDAASAPSVEPSASTIRASASLRQAVEEFRENGTSSTSNAATPISEPVSPESDVAGAQNIVPPVVEDDSGSDNDDVPPPPLSSTQSTRSSRFQATLSPPKRKPLEIEDALFFDPESLHPKPSTMVDIPRKKPKLIVEVVIPLRPKRPLSSRAPRLPRTPSDLEISGDDAGDRGSKLEAHGTDTSPVTPPGESKPTLSTSSMSSVYDNSPGPSSRNVKDRPPSLEPVSARAPPMDARAQSTELSYLDDFSEPPLPVIDRSDGQVHVADRAVAAIPTRVAPSVPTIPVQSTLAPETEDVPAPAPRDPPRIQDRLIGIPQFPIPIPNLPVEKFLVSKNWKNNLPFLSVPLRELLASRNHILPKLALNPYLPSEPGSPGLLYQANDRIKWEPGDQTVFIWLDYGLLRYVGEYCLELDGPMSEQEYQSWPPELKKTWAITILTMSEFRAIRTRILLSHQLGRRPAGKEVMDAVKRRRFDNLEGVAKSNARSAIVSAYERGEERMIVWRMKCVGFDEELVQQMEDMKNGTTQGNTQDIAASSTAAATA
ncbi:hypothetical protein C8Q70DRAFT_1030262 [Cubamyces menziesii]|nr:hypothetical protein C8Q70DRAFT_1030262 [Cubamyces menziesii]